MPSAGNASALSTRDVSVYIGPADVVARLIAEATMAQSPAVDE